MPNVNLSASGGGFFPEIGKNRKDQGHSARRNNLMDG
jgi:hypothetical protein